MVLFSLSFLAGQLLSAWGRLAPAVVLSALLPWVMAGRAPRLEPSARALLGAVLGLWIASRAVEPPSGCFLPSAAEKAWIEGEIAAPPQRTEEGLRLRVRARRRGDERPICGLLLLTVGRRGPEDRKAPRDLDGIAGEDLIVGDRVTAHVSLRRPRSFQDPGAWNQVAALARSGVWVTSWADAGDFQRVSRGEASSSRSLDRLRRRLARLVDASLPEPEAALARALVVGDQAGVPHEVWERVAAGGLAHLLSVSGLHIAVVWAAVFVPARWLLARSEWLLLSTDVRALAAAVAAVPALAYGALAGGSLPTERSLVMALLPLAALLCGREVDVRRILAQSALLLAVRHPGSPLDVSFQLSFVSVLAVVEGSRRWVGRVAKSPAPASWSTRLREYGLMAGWLSGWALAGTAPLVAFHFNRATPIGLFTNPLLVPTCGTPATLLGLVAAAVLPFSEPATRLLFRLQYWPLHALLGGVDVALSVPLASVRVPTPTLAELALLYAGILLVLSPRCRPWAPLWLLLVAADVGFWVHERTLARDLRVRFLDVGQGDAAVVELPRGGVLVIDGGGFSASRFDPGERVVAAYLWSRKILRVDVLVASHGDRDHQGGLHFLAREFAPREIWFPPAEARRLTALRRTVVASGGREVPLGQGDRRDLTGGVSAECLHPPSGGAWLANDASLALRFVFGDASFLFAGDVERAAEEAFAPRAQAVTVLKVPHHGSRTSSQEETLSALAPHLAVISVGAGNPFGFPHPAVLRRYRRLGVFPLRTDVDGSVSVWTDGRRVSARSYRERSRLPCSLFAALC